MPDLNEFKYLQGLNRKWAWLRFVFCFLHYWNDGSSLTISSTSHAKNFSLQRTLFFHLWCFTAEQRQSCFWLATFPEDEHTCSTWSFMSRWEGIMTNGAKEALFTVFGREQRLHFWHGLRQSGWLLSMPVSQQTGGNTGSIKAKAAKVHSASKLMSHS